MGRESVDLSQIGKILKEGFEIFDQINANWNKIYPCFDLQREWKFYYAYYTLYIKN